MSLYEELSKHRMPFRYLSYDSSGDRLLKVFSKSSVFTGTHSNIKKKTFKRSPLLNQDAQDGGNVAFYKDTEPQDILYTYKVGLSGTPSYPSTEILELPYLSNSIHAQKLGILHFEREIDKDASVSFEGSPAWGVLRPGDVITLSDADYGGTLTAVIESLTIQRSQLVNINAIVFAHSLRDWGDISPSTKLITADTPANAWQPLIMGPYSPNGNVNVMIGDIIVSGNFKTNRDPSTLGGMLINSTGIEAYKTTGAKFFDLDITTETLTLVGAFIQSPGGTTFPITCYRGAYDALTVYYQGDVVTYGGSSWVYINATSGAGHTPADDAYWDPYAASGTTARSVYLSTTTQGFAYDTAGVNHVSATHFPLDRGSVTCRGPHFAGTACRSRRIGPDRAGR